MQAHVHTDTAHTHFTKSTISWGAIFAGVVVALSIGVLFNLLGLAFGFSVFMPDVNTVTRIGAGSMIWLTITGIISMFIGGWVAGKSTAFTHHMSGSLHGLIAWGLATLFILILTATAAGAIITAGAATLMNKDLTPQTIAYQGLNANVNQVNPQVNVQNQRMLQNTEAASNTLGGIAFMTFIMFLLSAIAGAIGGYFGNHDKHVHAHLENPRI